MPRTPHDLRTAATGALAAALILLSSTPALGQDVAGDGTLAFQPDRPAAGETVEATYRPLPDLRGSRLHLRARERTRADVEYNDGMGSRTVAVLEPTEDGAYRGRFRFPDDVVYAAFAVEDPAATVTDSRGGDLWELLVHEDGRPLFAALVQRFHDHMGRDQRVVLEAARDMARLYPDTVEAWSMLRSAEGWVLGPEGAAERAVEHERRAARFDSVLRGRGDLDADQVGWMYAYASEELRDYWRARLHREHPGSFFAIQEQYVEQWQALREDPDALLRELERLWRLASDDEARAAVADLAFYRALRHDRELAGTWGDRWVSLSPSVRIEVLLGMARDGKGPELVRELESVIPDVEAAPDSARPLGATVAEHRDDYAQRAATLRAALGGVLLAAGREEEAAVALRQAAAVGWDTQRHLRLGDALLATGDTAGAIEALAAAAVDPALSEAAADSLRRRAPVSTTRWTDAMAAAREKMRRRTLASARDRPLDAVQVADPGGHRSDLEGLLGEEATVVAVWSRNCPASVRAMPDIIAMAQRLEAEGVPLLAITRDDPEQAAAYLDEAGLEPDVWFDPDGEVVRSLTSWATPQYFVLDRDGRLRFAYSSLADLPRHVWALREE